MAAPYRSRPRARDVALVVYPVLPLGLLVLVGVLFVIVSSLHAFLWSGVVHIHCARTGSEALVCEVDESTLVRSERSRHDARGTTRVEVRRERPRGESRLVLVRGSTEADLTSGFRGDARRERAAAEELSAFFEGTSASVDVTYGSRWFVACIFLVVFGGLFGIAYPLLGYRLRVTMDRTEQTLAIAGGVWPFIGRARRVPLGAFEGFRLDGKTRVRLVAVTKDQPMVPCSFRLGRAVELEKTADRLNGWVEEERQRPSL